MKIIARTSLFRLQHIRINCYCNYRLFQSIEYGVTLTCGDGEMTVSLVKSSYPTLNASRLHLNDASCRATENTSYITFYTSLDGCGTTRSETESWFTFYNQIKGEIGQIGSAVTRDHDFDMHFNCSYQRKKFLSLTFQPNGILRPPITGIQMSLL